MKKPIISLLIIVTALFLIWFFNLRTTEGYVISPADSSILVAESASAPEIKAKTQSELDEFYLFEGSSYDIPALNKFIKSEYKTGQKVKIYWHGSVMESAPSQIKGTFLIIKK
ncbi:DUF3221 domain-containing protein [Cytobacillus gottheilii]|uniref:DUF3221 domain-containing protein n=1 Tax=Cytobacillus gottheilii TaxID=859144 RepID=UPI0008328499|nr:DUF3221 domain-containing protein [Cytobacillus gottheilii]